MFKKTERLSRDQFDFFFKTGRRHHSEYLTLIHVPFPTLHIAVVVGKKVAKQAVTRNTIRRRLYAELRALKLQERTGVFIVIVKPSFRQLSRKAARAHMAAVIERIIKPA